MKFSSEWFPLSLSFVIIQIRYLFSPFRLPLFLSSPTFLEGDVSFYSQGGGVAGGAEEEEQEQEDSVSGMKGPGRRAGRGWD